MHSNELQCQERSSLLTCADQWRFRSAYAFAQPDQNLHWEHNANSAAQMRRQNWIVGGRTCQKVRPFWRCGSFESDLFFIIISVDSNELEHQKNSHLRTCASNKDSHLRSQNRIVTGSILDGQSHNFFFHADKEDSDQLVRMRRLIWDFYWCPCNIVRFQFCGSTSSRYNYLYLNLAFLHR